MTNANGRNGTGSELNGGDWSRRTHVAVQLSYGYTMPGVDYVYGL